MQTRTISYGRRQRESFARNEEIQEMPHLLDVQRDSYRWFEEEGLREAFERISPIQDFTGNLKLEFLDYFFDEPKYSVDESRDRDVTYSRPLRVNVRLVNKSTGEVKDQEVFMGDFPIMTENGTFIYNGAERVIVSQLVRSPGAYFKERIDKKGNMVIEAKIIPNRGAWIEYNYDKRNVVTVRIDRSRKIPVVILLRALGYGTNAEIIDLIGDTSAVQETLQKDSTESVEEGLLELYRKLRPGEPPTVDAARSLIDSMFFNTKRYDLADVGRYKLNKKLSLNARIKGRVSAENIVAHEDIYRSETLVDKVTGEVLGLVGDLLISAGELLLQEGEVVTDQVAEKLQLAGINALDIFADDQSKVRVFGNGFRQISWQEKLHNRVLAEDFPAKGKVILPRGTYIGTDELVVLEKSEKKIYGQTVKLENMAHPVVIANDYIVNDSECLLKEDIIAGINYVFNLLEGIGKFDDIDHLGNRRLRCVGELLQKEFRTGLSRMERVVRERMTIHDPDSVTPQALINIRPVVAKIKEFFGSSQLSQYMDQINPLAEISHKRTISALGPGGLNRDRASMDVRDVHHSHFGRICPIETPEGPNIGLIGRLGTYTKINEFGFMQTPYRVVDKGKGLVTPEVRYFTADEEEGSVFGQSSLRIDNLTGRILDDVVPARIDNDVRAVDLDAVDFIDISPKQVFGIATVLIPFLENDDANRALMGANMQKQAVPLLRPEAPLIGTGMEHKAAVDSGHVIVAEKDATVIHASARRIELLTDDQEVVTYNLHKFERSNQGTCLNQRPLVKPNERVKAGDIIADGPAIDHGELALGRNMLCGFLNWHGYNYEDAIIINENVVKRDDLTSVHIEEYEAEARDTKLGAEEITRDIPNVGEDALRNLDARGIVRIGAEVKSGDILVGKITPKGETELTAEERLLRAIFGEKAREVRDTSTKVPHGAEGIVVNVRVFSRDNGDELPPGVNQLVRVYVANKRKISVGDKMAGRHGNKGIVAKIVPEEDMPFLEDGRPLDIILTPLGLPSRMNLGQIFEIHLGWAAEALGIHIATPIFDGATEEQIQAALRKAGLPESGKAVLYDGKTGEKFGAEATVGVMYMLKLFHLVDDKIHARSTGPYSLVTQQPLGGKAQFGGQRFGEMEVWALEAYGAAYTLQEMLTIKSDDVTGRVKAYEAIVKGENIPQPGIPESFKVLIKEMQSLGLDINIVTDAPIEDDEGGVFINDLPDRLLNREEWAPPEEIWIADRDPAPVEDVPALDDFDHEEAEEAAEDEEKEMTLAERIAKLSELIRPRIKEEE